MSHGPAGTYAHVSHHTRAFIRAYTAPTIPKSLQIPQFLWLLSSPLILIPQVYDLRLSSATVTLLLTRTCHIMIRSSLLTLLLQLPL